MRSTILMLIIALASMNGNSICQAAFLRAGASGSAAANPPATQQFAKRTDIVLADGTSMQYSSASLPNGLKWQASGFLQHGGCSSGKQFITDCYEMRLVADPAQQLDPGSASPRQRIEFLTAHQADGSKWHYVWRSYVPNYVTGSTTFFHLMQIFSTATGGSIFFLDIIKNMVYIKDVVAGVYAASAPLSSFENRPLQHTMNITYGPSGNIWYSVTDSQTNAPIISFSKTGGIGSGGTYLKFGAYRATYQGESSVKAWYGDFVQTQL
ncbi:hypothetical protein DL93DRAFT_1125129 [Clavulina sp. PMI_390]|nr:hypothetical protein DL93DRAFT_1125129 [Clavulina sp. PMI_390]